MSTSNFEAFLTETFSGEVKPARPGVYQRFYTERNGSGKWLFCLYNHGQWYCHEATIDEAERVRVPSPFCNSIPWRGLTKQFTGD